MWKRKSAFDAWYKKAYGDEAKKGTPFVIIKFVVSHLQRIINEGSFNMGKSRSMSGSFTYVIINTSKDCNIKFYGVLKEKSSTLMYDQFGELKYKYGSREFCCKGYYLDTEGNNAEE